MAKGNLFLGQARGKVGSVVFARAFGEQITRTRPTSVANPKTIGQNTQRAILATIAKSAAAMTRLVDHSFAGVAYGAESVRHFRKINMGMLRNLYLNTQNDANLVAKGGSFVPNPLKVSEGNLPPFVSIVDGEDIGFLQDAAHPLSSASAIDVATFLESFPYLQGGDQLTLVKIKRVNNGELINGDALFTMTLDRMVFTTEAFSNPAAVIIDADNNTINETFLDMTKTTDSECLSRNPATGGLGFSSDGNIYFAAVILSRKVNNVWQRSTQSLEQINFDDHTNNESAIASYGANVSISDETEYLNQAEEGEVISGISGAYMNVSHKVGDGNAEIAQVYAGETSPITIQGTSGAMVSIDAEAFAPAGKRIVTVELDRPDGSYAAHQAKTLHYNVAITAQTAGVWPLTALFDDGSKAILNITLAVQA